MKKQLLVAVVGWLAFCLAGTATPAQAQHTVRDVRAFVTTLYYEGLPYGEAKSYGPGVLPQLYDMLADDELQPYWANIVGMIGYLGEPSSIQPLLDFVHRQKGEISVNQFRAVLQVLPAIGHISQTGDVDALDTSVRYTERDSWQKESLQFSYGRYHDTALSEVLGRMAILGLGISGTPKAMAYLASMQSGNLRRGWVDNVAEAIALNQRVSTEGASHVFNRVNQ